MGLERTLNKFRSGIDWRSLRKVDGSMREKARSLRVWRKSVPRKVRELDTDSLITRLQASVGFGEVWGGP